MRDYDDHSVEVWVASPTSDAEAALATEDIQRRMIRDRMLGLWRGAVDAVGKSVAAEHQRRAEEEAQADAPHAAKARPTWNVKAWNRGN